MDWRENAADFISELLDEDPVLLLQEVFDAILAQQLQNLHQLEEFLENLEDTFFVENGRVALRIVDEDDLVQIRNDAVAYFEAALRVELNRYNRRPNYYHFRGHIGQAREDIQDFINDFYPEEEFRNFLLAHPDVFQMFDDNTVSLIEYECVNYFKECVTNREGQYTARNLRGRLGQAPNYIIEFINENYPGDSFLDFLENNADVFDIDDDGFVFLTENNDEIDD